MLSIDELRGLMSYNPSDGIFTWLHRNPEFYEGRVARHERAANLFNSKYAGSPALTSTDAAGYKYGMVLGRNYKAHRVAWAIHYGCWPDGVIDHIDGDVANNAIANLRSVSQLENTKNSSMRSDNSSGVVGVNWDKRRSNWRAYINSQGKQVYIGAFGEFSDAVNARLNAERSYGYHENHGKSKR